MDKIVIYTDGSSRGNPGPGGYGAILMWGNKVKELSGAFRKTNNLPVNIYTDSKYVVESVEKKWLDNWIRTDFKGGKKNKDLWTIYYELAKPFKVKFHWVKGHAENPYNNRCDELATLAADNGPWEIDTEFEKI
jgi:ribonuclease HI